MHTYIMYIVYMHDMTPHGVLSFDPPKMEFLKNFQLHEGAAHNVVSHSQTTEDMLSKY